MLLYQTVRAKNFSPLPKANATMHRYLSFPRRAWERETKWDQPYFNRPSIQVGEVRIKPYENLFVLHI